MCDDSDSDVSELDVESKTWNKIEKNMRLIGFREGAAKGQELSLQEGFNLGYSDGYELGEYLGMVKGIVSYQTKTKPSESEKPQLSEEALFDLSNQACVTCLEEKKNSEASSSEDVPSKKLEDIISAQQIVNKKIITTLKDSKLKTYLEKG